MNYILLHWSYGRESMKMVADRMTEPCHLLAKKNSGDWMEYSPEHGGWSYPESIMKILHNPENRVINWGNHIFNADSYFAINIPSAIALASDKSRSRRFLQEAGVKVPKTWFPNEDFNGTLPIIARPSSHHGGKDFYVLKTPNDYNDLASKYNWNLFGWYFSEIFEKTTEFRVHCAHGKVLIVNEKPLVEGELRANQAVNHESWRALKWSEFHPGICQEALKAVEVLGLDYGAVDIMYNAENNTWAICEVNTSPSVNTEYASGKYAAYFSWLIRHDFPEHFPVEGKSVFYNDILRS